MILEAAYRIKADTSAPVRHVNHDAAKYEDAYAAAQAEKREGETLLYVRRIED